MSVSEHGFWQVLARDAKHFLWGAFYDTPKPLSITRFLYLVSEPDFRLVFWFRLYSFCCRKGFNRISYLMYARCKRRYRVDIAREATIGGGLRITHGFDIIIGPEAVVGNDVIIFNGVTVGYRIRRNGTDGMPKIGSQVLIGTGAKLLGPITVGDNARIGANAVVLESVGDGCTAVGNPARVLEKNRHQTGPNA